MKILYLTNHLNTGGISSYLFTLSKGLKNLGHDIFILSNSGDLTSKFESLGVNLLNSRMRLKSDADPRIYFFSDHLKFLRNQKIDIIHSQTRVSQIIGWRFSKILRIHFLSTCHGFFKPRLTRRIFPCWGNRVIAISQPVKQHLENDFKVDSSKIAFIPNGIDLTEFNLPTQEYKREMRLKYHLGNGPVVGIIARLSDVKGHEDLLHAFKIVLNVFPLAKLLIVGQGPMEEELHRLTEGLGITKQVQFLSVINRTAEILTLLDVFVMPSLQEGLGLSVLEAQAMGVPVVATRVGGLPDIVENNRTGLLVEPRNPKMLAHAICEFLSNPAKAWDVGRMARMFVEKNYCASRMVRSTFNLYQQLVES